MTNHLDLCEQLARIDRKQARIQQLIADRDCQEIKYAPWFVAAAAAAFTAFATGASLTWLLARHPTPIVIQLPPGGGGR